MTPRDLKEQNDFVGIALILGGALLIATPRPTPINVYGGEMHLREHASTETEWAQDVAKCAKLCPRSMSIQEWEPTRWDKRYTIYCECLEPKP